MMSVIHLLCLTLSVNPAKLPPVLPIVLGVLARALRGSNLIACCMSASSFRSCMGSEYVGVSLPL